MQRFAQATALIAGFIALNAVAGDPAAIRLPDDVPPVIGAWFWYEDAFEPEGYRGCVDLFAQHAPYDLLTTSFRVPEREVTDRAVHDQVKEAAAYARERGMDVALDIDVRLARAAFQKAYPDELQEMLRLRTVALEESGDVEIAIESEVLRDHMTGNTTPYLPLSGRLVCAYSYVPGPGGIEPDTVRDVTSERCTVKLATAEEVRITITCDTTTQGRTLCVMAAFTLFTPAVHAPHLLEFQRAIVAQYADTGLAGLAKDEWGYPPCYDGCPDKNDFWYSRFRAAAYAERTGGRDLARDCLLMYAGERGRRQERQAAINHLREMSRVRNAAIEDDYYRAAKETFGPNAFVVTHATWMPYPGTAEFKKNGLDWWAATRDLGQTDEVVPYCARTSLAKKWGSPVWYNQYYSTDLANYEENVWAHALGGGRVNYHPLYPYDDKDRKYADLLAGGLMRGDCRIRLLNFISKSPVDCPVAVIFGHACAMNWAGAAYDDVGLAVTDGLWREGFYADLIPSSEISDGALKVNAEGYVQYGAQSYAAAVLYHPEFERPDTAVFFQRASKGKTALFRVGPWTSGFDAKPFDGAAALPPDMIVCADAASCVARVTAQLRELGVRPHTPATAVTKTHPGFQTAAPHAKGRIHLIDGTEILLSGADNVAGDPIVASFEAGGHEVTVDAVGVAAVRLAEDGTLEAMAAGGLRRFEAGGVAIELPERVDAALWRDERGEMRGVLQGWSGPVPASLLAVTSEWLMIGIPKPAP